VVQLKNEVKRFKDHDKQRRNPMKIFAQSRLYTCIGLFILSGLFSLSVCTITIHAQSPVQVLIQNFAFNPADITISVGTTVVWTNLDSFSTHTVTSGSSGIPDGKFDSGGFGTNGTYSRVFQTAGVFPYYCAVHTFMTGTVTVTSSGGTTKVQVETAANGSGTVAPLQNITAGSSITVYAVTRDANNNFLANVSATWTLISKTGGVVDGDLAAAPDGKSAVFSAHSVGSAQIDAASGAFLKTPSGTLTVTPGTAAKLAFGIQPGNTASGLPVTPAITVRITDTFNNLIIGDARNVSVEIGTNPGGGTLSGIKSVAASGGVATFSGLSIDKTGAGYTLSAASSPVLTGAVSVVFTITSGVAVKVQVESAADGSGTAIPLQNITAGSSITVYAVTRDVNDNFVANVSASWALINKTGGIANGDLAVADDSKSAVFTGHSAGTVQIEASLGTLARTPSGILTVTPGTAVKLAFGVQPGNTAAGFPVTPAITILILDAFNNLVTGDTRNVTVAIGTNPGGGTLIGTKTAAASGGVATFSSLSIDRTGAGYTLSASSTPVLAGAISSAFTITLGTAAKFVITGNSTQKAGSSQSLTITARDSGGNTAVSFTGDMSLIFSGANPSANPVKSPTVTDITGAPVNFGSATTITFNNGIAVASGNKNGAMTLYNAETAIIAATQGSITTTGSDRLTVTVTPSIFVILPPLNVVASDVPNDQGHALSLTWTVSPSESGGGVTWYRILRSRTNILTTPIPITQFATLDSLNAWDIHATILIDSVKAGVTSYRDSVPLNGATYYYWLQAEGNGIASKIVAASFPTKIDLTPEEYSLSQNYPNPFNPSTTIQYSIEKTGMVSLKVYNFLGQEVATLVNGSQEAGRHTATFNALKVNLDPGSGVYFYRLESGPFVSVKKFVFMK
jgi:plastocyanin